MNNRQRLVVTAQAPLLLGGGIGFNCEAYVYLVPEQFILQWSAVTC